MINRMLNPRVYDGYGYAVSHALAEVQASGLTRLGTPPANSNTWRFLEFWAEEPLAVALKLLASTTISVRLSFEEQQELTTAVEEFVSWVQQHYVIVRVIQSSLYVAWDRRHESDPDYSFDGAYLGPPDPYSEPDEYEDAQSDDEEIEWEMSTVIRDVFNHDCIISHKDFVTDHDHWPRIQWNRNFYDELTRYNAVPLWAARMEPMSADSVEHYEAVCYLPTALAQLAEPSASEDTQ